MERLIRGSKEWNIEVVDLSALLQTWKAHPDDNVVQIAILQSMEKLGLVVDQES